MNKFCQVCHRVRIKVFEIIFPAGLQPCALDIDKIIIFGIYSFPKVLNLWIPSYVIETPPFHFEQFVDMYAHTGFKL